MRVGSSYCLSFTPFQVLELSPGKGRIPVWDCTTAIFLDEFRMMLTSPTPTEDPPEFTFFNTLVPQDHPNNLRRLRFPQTFRRCMAFLVDGVEMALGTFHSNGPLIADPTQALLVVNLRGGTLSKVFVILRVQALIAHMCSTDGNTHIPWDELGRDAMIMKLPENVPLLLLQGVHIIEPKTRDIPGDENHFRLRTFDFSRRGSSLRCEKSANGEWTALYEGEQDIIFEGYESTGGWTLYSLGNGALYSIVSCLP